MGAAKNILNEKGEKDIVELIEVLEEKNLLRRIKTEVSAELEITEILENYELEDGISKETTRKRILEQIARYLTSNIPVNQDMDDWVATYFSGKSDLNGILDSLSKCELQQELCDKVFVSIAERSPTALVLTLKLLRRNEGRPLPDVFATELKAAKFIIRHPDYLEGIRARLIDRDDKPIWKPDKLAEVDLANLKI